MGIRFSCDITLAKMRKSRHPDGLRQPQLHRVANALE
jgi:hypothetical protein